MSFFNRQIIKENYPILLALVFIWVMAFVFGQIADEAKAAEVYDVNECSTSLPNFAFGSSSPLIIGYQFIQTKSNISKVYLNIGGQDCEGATTTAGIYLKHTNSNTTLAYATSSVNCSGSDLSIDLTEPIDVVPGDTFEIWATPLDGFPTFAGYVIGKNYREVGDDRLGLPSWLWEENNTIEPACRRTWYEDTRAEQIPDYATTSEVIILDSETIFAAGLAYNFERKNCYLEQDIDCELKYTYSIKSIGVPLYMTYKDWDYGVIATDTPMNNWSYSDSVIVPNPLTHMATNTASFYLDYCVTSYSTSTLETYEKCGIRVNWLTDEDINRVVAQASAEASHDNCIGTSTDENFMSHSLKIFGCWAVYPSASALMDLYDLKLKAKQQFPINIFQDIQDRIDYHRINQLKGSSTIATSSGIFLFFDGVTQSNAKIFGADVIYNGLPEVWTNIRGYLAWFVWFVLVIYAIKKLMNLPIFSSQYKNAQSELKVMQNQLREIKHR